PSTPACAERPPPSPAHAASSDRRRRAAAPARESGPRAAAPRRGGPSAEKEGGEGSGGSPATRPAETAGRMAEGAGARSKGVARLAIEAVLGLDVADRPALGAHHHRVGLRAPLEEAHAPEEVARGHAGRGEHHVAARELLQGEDLVEVLDAHRAGALGLRLVARLEAALEVAAHAADRRRGEDALGRAVRTSGVG